ncbi:MAG: MFS transporter [Catenulispora sp.]|nr:MFS transporter [Catenulispora sp.]NUR61006.1 MFS transporter [Catenulispora sp.]
MRGLWRDYRSFSPTARLLMVNQLTINIAFYLLMPYLAGHLSGDLKLAGWAVGLILGVRNLSQQGMFALGGALADRYGSRNLIIAGCGLRVVAFTLLGLAGDLPGLITGSVLTGLAGAMFNPAVRSYLAREAGKRRVEAFATFNVFYQAGILLGPPLGLALTGVDFRTAALAASGLFAALTVAQLRRLPPQSAESNARPPSMAAGWRAALGNRTFLGFAAAMTGSYILSFQIYLMLPLLVTGHGGGQAAVTAMFIASGAAGLAGQVRITAWCRTVLTPAQALLAGVTLMPVAFLPPAAAESFTGSVSPGYAQALAVASAVTSALLLTVATAIAYPFEMNTITCLARDRLVATHYGVYSTITGLGITVGTLGAGALSDAARVSGHPALPWLGLTVLGLASAAGLAVLTRTPAWAARTLAAAT